MALSDELNTNLAYDTDVFRECGVQYGKVAEDLRLMSNELDICLTELKNNGWTTPAGTAFHKMVNTNWRENITKYATLLETLKSVLIRSAFQYDTLTSDYITSTKL